MNLTSEEHKERNAHMLNMSFGVRGVLTSRDGVPTEATYVGSWKSPFTGMHSFDFISSRGNHTRRESIPHWDFEPLKVEAS